jgi:hypothetical protein
VVAVGEPPGAALHRVEAAVDDLPDFVSSRRGDRVTITKSSDVLDRLEVTATRMEVGTRVELKGHIEPRVTHQVLRALAMSRPWMWAPAWDEPPSS